MHRHHTAATGALLVALLALAGCGSSAQDDTGSGSAAGSSTASSPSGSPSDAASGSAEPSASAEPASAPQITIKDYDYTVPASVSPGEKVEVVNQDDVAHTVTADSGDAFDVNVPGGSTVMLTAPDRAGTYAFSCSYHAEMHGKLVVG